MVFDTISPTNHMCESLPSSFIENPLADECNFPQIESPKQKIISKTQDDCENDIYMRTNQYHRLKSSTINSSTSVENLRSITPINEESADDHHLSISPTKSLSITELYSNSSMTSYSSSSSISSSNLSLINSDSHHKVKPEIKTFSSSSSSGYDSSSNSIPDQFFSSLSDSILIPDFNLVEQFINTHLEKQTSFDNDINFSSASSLSSLSSSYFSQELSSYSLTHNQLLSDTDDDSQATTIPNNSIQDNTRPRSLPIAIQQPKCVLNGDETDNSSQSDSLCQYSISIPEKNGFQTCKLTSSIDQSDSNEQIISNQSLTLERFIMSPTDQIKIQMKYQQDDMKNNELRISQPEDIDFKRSKLKAMRVLYQNRINLNSIQSSVTNYTLIKISSRTVTYCHSPLAKRTPNPRLLRSVLSCSVFEVDDEHEVVSSTTPTNVNGTREKTHMELFHCLRVNFTESLLHGKILPCGVLDGFTVKLGASGLFIPKQIILPVTTFWFDISEHPAASPYLGFVNLQCLPKRGYHTPTKGTITLALLNPNGTAVHLFLILYDLSDMPPDHRTFIRQRIVLMPDNISDDKTCQPSKENLRYLAHIRFVTSQTGKLYMHSDIRIIFARNKLDYDERTGGGKPQLTTSTDMPTPKYWPRK